MAKPTKVPAIRASTPATTAAVLLQRARIADVRAHEGALSAEGEPDSDAVHDMRVAARRLRVAIDLLGTPGAHALEAQVKALQDALGDLRDVQVQRDWVADHGNGRAAMMELARRLDEERPPAEKRVRTALRAWRTAVAPALEEQASASDVAGKLGGGRLSRAVRRAAARLERKVDALDGELEPRAAHAVRIAAKKVRYLSELVAPAHPKRTRPVLDRLEPFLDRIGALHDADVRVARLEALGSATGTPPRERDAARTLLQAVRTERAKQARAIEEELGRWRELGFLRAVRRAFGRAGSRKHLRALASAVHQEPGLAPRGSGDRPATSRPAPRATAPAR